MGIRAQGERHLAGDPPAGVDEEEHGPGDLSFKRADRVCHVKRMRPGLSIAVTEILRQERVIGDHETMTAEIEDTDVIGMALQPREPGFERLLDVVPRRRIDRRYLGEGLERERVIV